MRTLTIAIIGALSLASNASADECSDLLRDSVFNSEEIKENGKEAQSFVSWQCSTSFKSHQEAVDAGLNVGVPVYGVPLEIGGTWNSGSVETWKQENCSAANRKESSESATFRLVRKVAPEIVAGWSSCMESRVSQRAMNCKMSRLGDKTVFEAKWRRTEGDISAPQVLRWNVSGGSCSPILNAGDTLTEAAFQSACVGEDGQDFVIMLETSRGSCWQPIPYQPTREVISGVVNLDGHRTVKAEVVEFASGARVVTNGFNFSAVADREMKVSGDAKILSFENRNGNPGKHGRPAGQVLVQAPKISGGVLHIENFGEDGLKGEKGEKGATGPKGARGYGGIWKDLRGCVEREEAGMGGKGGTGGVGLVGGNGGNGGAVTINVKAGLVDGALERVRVVTVQGGGFGSGGDGGDGGNGGPGGDGQGGRSPGCGGVGGGPTGPQGDTGPTGANGQPGSPGSVVKL